MTLKQRITALEGSRPSGWTLDTATLSEATQAQIRAATTGGKLDAAKLSKEAQREILAAASYLRNSEDAPKSTKT